MKSNKVVCIFEKLPCFFIGIKSYNYYIFILLYITLLLLYIYIVIVRVT